MPVKHKCMLVFVVGSTVRMDDRVTVIHHYTIFGVKCRTAAFNVFGSDFYVGFFRIRGKKQCRGERKCR